MQGAFQISGYGTGYPNISAHHQERALGKGLCLEKGDLKFGFNCGEFEIHWKHGKKEAEQESG